MLKTGSQHLETLRDGRMLYLGDERVEDATTHPAFKGAAATVAAIYDLKASDADLSFTEDGERFSNYYLRPRSVCDLRARTASHRAIARKTFGMFGRSPDHVASFVTGMTMMTDVFEEGNRGYRKNIVAHYDYMRRNDIYATYAVLTPPTARYADAALPEMQSPSLSVVAEDSEGVTISGMKLLATGAAYANEVWFGNILPLKPEHRAESITCAVPMNARGLSLWSRKPTAPSIPQPKDGILSSLYDESDCIVICDKVRVPWERVFVHNNPAVSRDIYIKTPGHSFSNHQANVRFWAKLAFLVGLASRVTQATGAVSIPAVQETLGRLAGYEALLGSAIMGQIEQAESWGTAYVGYNRRGVYAVGQWCYENYSGIIDTIRELCGGGAFQMPASASVLDNEELNSTFARLWATPRMNAQDRMSTFRLAWDVTGSEFAGRHQTYEMFYLGARHVVRNHNFREAPWPQFEDMVGELLGMDV